MSSTPLSMRDLPNNERPRERLLNYGASSLSAAELLAIVLRTGTAQENVLRLAERILSQFDGLRGLAQVSSSELEKIKGLGATKTTQLLAVMEIARRLTVYQPGDHPIISNSTEAAKLVMDMGQLPQEHVRIILLDSSRRVIAIPTVYIGTLNASVLRVSEIYREAITRNSPAVILVHNHPSGDPSPSPDDIEITRTLYAAGKLLDIALLDHLIIAGHRWASLRELGFGFER